MEENNSHFCPGCESGVWCIGGMVTVIGKQCSDKSIIFRPEKKLVHDTGK